MKFYDSLYSQYKITINGAVPIRKAVKSRSTPAMHDVTAFSGSSVLEIIINPVSSQ